MPKGLAAKRLIKKGMRGFNDNGGRKKGTPNKFTASAKEAIQLAFEGIGGVPALIEWAEKNRGDFYKLYARLIPLDVRVQEPEGHHLTIMEDARRVAFILYMGNRQIEQKPVLDYSAPTGEEPLKEGVCP